MKLSITIGYDSRDPMSFKITANSVKRRLKTNVPVFRLDLMELMFNGIYRRPLEVRDGKLWDSISEAHMSTEFANSRFLVPYLRQRGWAVFMDADMLSTVDLTGVLQYCDDRYAVMCVKHDYQPKSSVKMNGELQQFYARKNWSSFMVFNCDHPANAPVRNSASLANTVPGRDLHRFCWLHDYQIGELPPTWNFLVGDHKKTDELPHIIHFTEGVPTRAGYEDCDYADLWMEEKALIS